MNYQCQDLTMALHTFSPLQSKEYQTLYLKPNSQQERERERDRGREEEEAIKTYPTNGGSTLQSYRIPLVLPRAPNLFPEVLLLHTNRKTKKVNKI